MKTLEQLGISPAPWKMEYSNDIDRVVSVADANNKTIVETDYGFYPPELPDARMIAAAPELYVALRMYQEVFEKIRKSAWFIDANFHEIMSLNKVMTAADAALAKAGGAWCEREYGEADNARA